MKFLRKLYWRFRHRTRCSPSFTVLRSEVVGTEFCQFQGWYVKAQLRDVRFRCDRCGRVHRSMAVHQTSHEGVYEG